MTVTQLSAASPPNPMITGLTAAIRRWRDAPDDNNLAGVAQELRRQLMVSLTALFGKESPQAATFEELGGMLHELAADKEELASSHERGWFEALRGLAAAALLLLRRPAMPVCFRQSLLESVLSDDNRQEISIALAAAVVRTKDAGLLAKYQAFADRLLRPVADAAAGRPPLDDFDRGLLEAWSEFAGRLAQRLTATAATA